MRLAACALHCSNRASGEGLVLILNVLPLLLPLQIENALEASRAWQPMTGIASAQMHVRLVLAPGPQSDALDGMRASAVTHQPAGGLQQSHAQNGSTPPAVEVPPVVTSPGAAPNEASLGGLLHSLRFVRHIEAVTDASIAAGYVPQQRSAQQLPPRAASRRAVGAWLASQASSSHGTGQADGGAAKSAAYQTPSASAGSRTSPAVAAASTGGQGKERARAPSNGSRHAVLSARAAAATAAATVAAEQSDNNDQWRRKTWRRHRKPRVCWWLQVEVTNRGKPPPDDAIRLFAPYERTAQETLDSLSRSPTSAAHSRLRSGAIAFEPGKRSGSAAAAAEEKQAAPTAAAGDDAGTGPEASSGGVTLATAAAATATAIVTAPSFDGPLAEGVHILQPEADRPTSRPPRNHAVAGREASASTVTTAVPESVESVGLGLPIARLFALELGARIGLFAQPVPLPVSATGEHIVSFVLQVPLVSDFRCIKRSWADLVSRKPPSPNSASAGGVSSAGITRAADAAARAQMRLLVKSKHHEAAPGASLLQPTTVRLSRWHLGRGSDQRAAAAAGVPLSPSPLPESAETQAHNARLHAAPAALHVPGAVGGAQADRRAAAASAEAAAAESGRGRASGLRRGPGQAAPHRAMSRQVTSMSGDTAAARRESSVTGTTQLREASFRALGQSASMSQAGSSRAGNGNHVRSDSGMRSRAVSFSTGRRGGPGYGHWGRSSALLQPATRATPGPPQRSDAAAGGAPLHLEAEEEAERDAVEGSGGHTAVAVGDGDVASTSPRALSGGTGETPLVLLPPPDAQAGPAFDARPAPAASANALPALLAAAAPPPRLQSAAGDWNTAAEEGASSDDSRTLEAPDADVLAEAVPTAPSPRLPPRVLVVDDEPVIRRIHARYLTRLGFEAEAVEDGDACVHAMKAADAAGRPFSAILMDIVMRRVHGDQACRDLRAASFRLPVIAATGNAGPRDVERLFANGFNAVLEKPFSIAQLSAVLQSCGVEGPTI